MGFTKLFSDIVMSTIWQEDDKTRIVWITMLATSDAFGRVNASVPGLAKAANVSLAECQKALDKLSAPDVYSRTKDHEGRRIKEIDGGWLILNYQKYREKGRSISRAEYFRKYRESQKAAKNAKNLKSATGAQPFVTIPNQKQPIAEAEAEELRPAHSAQIPIAPLKSDSKTNLTPTEFNQRKNNLLKQLKKT